MIVDGLLKAPRGLPTLLFKSSIGNRQFFALPGFPDGPLELGGLWPRPIHVHRSFLARKFPFLRVPEEALLLVIRDVGHVAGHRRAAPEIDVLDRLLAAFDGLEEIAEVVLGAFRRLLESLAFSVRLVTVSADIRRRIVLVGRHKDIAGIFGPA